MGILKTPIVILLTELRTMNSETGPIPWCWTGFAQTMKFPPGSYPVSGISKLPMTAPDLAGIADRPTAYNELQAFFKAVDDVKGNEKAVRARCADSQANQYQSGVKRFRMYWTKVTTRAKLSTVMDKLLLERDAMPWQVAKATSVPWPPPSGKGFGTLRVRDTANRKGVSLCTEIFGEECTVTADSVHNMAIDILVSMVQLAWDRGMKREPKLRDFIETARTDASAAWTEFQNVPSTMPATERRRMLKELLKKVKAYCDVLKNLGEEGILEAQAHEDDVRQMIESLKGKNKGRLTGRASGLEWILEALKNPEDILELERAYEESFAAEESLETVIEEVGDSQEWLDKDGDHGVGEFKALNVAQIRNLLGLPSNHMPFFNRVIHDLGTWPEDIIGFEEVKDLEDEEKLREVRLRRLEPKWHQYVGLAACVKRFFNNENVILADGVGVGKTMQCMMIMAYLRHLKVTKAKLPPIAYMKIGSNEIEEPSGDSPNWGWRRSAEPYPNGDIFVAVPNALANQWYSEAKRMLDSKYWNILLYPANEIQRRRFWDEVWGRVPGGVSTILIVTHTILRAEASRCIQADSTRRMLPAVGPTIIKLGNTIFSQNWSLAFWDEAQWLRTEGHLLRAAHAIRIRSASMVFCSATPLHNGEKDLISLGLALAMKERPELLQLEEDLRKELNRVVRENKVAERRDATEWTEALMTGEDLIAKPGTREHEKQSARIDVVTKMRMLFKSVVIRRRNRSVDNEGNVINGLPPLKKNVFFLDMSEDQNTRYELIRQTTAEKIGTTAVNARTLPTKTFFSEYRLAVGHDGFFGTTPSTPPTLYESRTQWVEQRSVKWATITKLLIALLSAKADEEIPTVENGSIKFHNDIDPEELYRSKLDAWAERYQADLMIGVAGTSRDASKASWPICDDGRTKVIVYVEFVKTLEHLIRGLELSGIRVIAAAGRKVRCGGHLWTRDEAITAFMDPSMNYRVLLLSSVGNAGLNLHMARYMIFADAVWSGQSEEQIIGRMYRQPNEQRCVVYIPLVRRTSDEILITLGAHKSQLLDIFYEGEQDDGNFVEHKNDDEEEDGDKEYIDKTSVTKEPKRGQGRGRGKGGKKAVVEAKEQESGETVKGKGSGSKPKGKGKGKEKEAQTAEVPGPSEMRQTRSRAKSRGKAPKSAPIVTEEMDVDVGPSAEIESEMEKRPDDDVGVTPTDAPMEESTAGSEAGMNDAEFDSDVCGGYARTIDLACGEISEGAEEGFGVTPTGDEAKGSTRDSTRDGQADKVHEVGITPTDETHAAAFRDPARGTVGGPVGVTPTLTAHPLDKFNTLSLAEGSTARGKKITPWAGEIKSDRIAPVNTPNRSSSLSSISSSSSEKSKSRKRDRSVTSPGSSTKSPPHKKLVTRRKVPVVAKSDSESSLEILDKPESARATPAASSSHQALRNKSKEDQPSAFVPRTSTVIPKSAVTLVAPPRLESKGELRAPGSSSSTAGKKATGQSSLRASLAKRQPTANPKK